MWPSYTLKKLILPENLLLWREEFEKKKCTLATVNGSFDLLHSGHLHILFEGAKQADVFLVALNSDASIKRYKSPLRPIIPLEERLKMISAIEWVDFVTWFEEDDPRELLEKVRPHVHVNGVEYGPNCIEADVVKKHGGKLHLVSKIEGLSTSNIVEKILAVGIGSPCAS